MIVNYFLLLLLFFTYFVAVYTMFMLRFVQVKCVWQTVYWGWGHMTFHPNVTNNNKKKKGQFTFLKKMNFGPEAFLDITPSFTSITCVVYCTKSELWMDL